MKKEIIFIDEDTLTPEELQNPDEKISDEDYELLKESLIALGCWDEEDEYEQTEE